MENVEGIDRVYVTAANRMQAPFAFIYPSDEWLTRGTKFGSYDLNLNVQVVVKHSASREVIIDNLEYVMTEVVEQLTSDGYVIGVVESPRVVEVDGSTHLSAEFGITINL